MSTPTTHPYTRVIQPGLDTTKQSVGGLVVECTAATTLLIGDAVFMQSTGTVTKSTTPANYTAFVGVVVGGKQTQGDLVEVVGRVGATAALVNESVWVQITGIVYINTTGAVALGNSLIGSATTAGRGAAGTTAGQMFGTVLEVASGSIVKMLINPR